MDQSKQQKFSIVNGCRTTEIYEKLELIGAGTYGQVWKAREKATNELVAIKRIRMESEKEGFPITAIREIKILKQLNFVNVVKLKEIITSTEPDDMNSVYLVFEYMDHDLAGLLDSDGFKSILKEDQIKCYFKQLLNGLLFLHRSSILHRDIKTANLLINNKGELKLADFGLARPLLLGQTNHKYTNKVITLWYRPPELLLGSTQYGPAIDVWSAGCVFAELLERRSPFSGNHKTEEEQIDLIWKLVGSPTPETWPNVDQLPYYAHMKPKKQFPSTLRARYGRYGAEAVELLTLLLTLDPEKRITAEKALDCDYFYVEPLPCEPKNIPAYMLSSHEYTSKNRRRKLHEMNEENQNHLQNDYQMKKAKIYDPRDRSHSNNYHSYDKHNQPNNYHQQQNSFHQHNQQHPTQHHNQYQQYQQHHSQHHNQPHHNQHHNQQHHNQHHHTQHHNQHHNQQHHNQQHHNLPPRLQNNPNRDNHHNPPPPRQQLNKDLKINNLTQQQQSAPLLPQVQHQQQQKHTSQQSHLQQMTIQQQQQQIQQQIEQLQHQQFLVMNQTVTQNSVVVSNGIVDPTQNNKILNQSNINTVPARRVNGS